MSPARQPTSALHRALAAFRQEPADHLPVRLLAAGGRAAEAGDWPLAWLLADRLVRLDLPNGEAGYCLRAAAHAQLGDATSAIVDLAQARHLAPDHPVILTLDISSSDAALRQSALQRALLGEDATLRETALSCLAADGTTAVMIGEVGAGGITAQFYWRGPPCLTLRWTDGETHATLPPLVAEPALHPDWPHAGRLTMDWPGSQQALTIELAAGADGRFVLAPAILYAPPPETPEPTEPVASSKEGGLLILIPVYGDAAATLACLDSLFASGLKPGTRIIVIDDASPDHALVARLQDLAQEGRIALLRNTLNLGFARAINRGLACRRSGEDVLLLNADTLLPPGAVERLAAAAADPTIGTATPLSNNGEDTSLPLRFSANPMPDLAGLIALDRLAQQANPGLRIDLPNGVGFCLYIRRDVLAAIGPLSTDYGRGYYEDVDFCLRAREAGFRSVCAADVVVGHHGSRSFGGEKAVLVRRNQKHLEARFPDYRASARAYRDADPLREAVGRIEDLWLKAGHARFHLVLAPGEVPRWLLEQMMEQAEADGSKPVLAQLAPSEEGLEATLTSRHGFPQNLTLRQPSPRQLLLDYPWAGIRLVEPEALPAALLAACHDLPLPVARIPLCALAVSEPRLNIVQPDQPAHAAASLALIGDADDPAAGQLAAELGRLAPELALAILGWDGQKDSAATPLLWPAGTVPRLEIGGWLQRAGLSACLVTSRRYGVYDGAVPQWLAAGLRVALFDPTLTKPVRTAHCLRLPATSAEAEVARQLISWLGETPRP